MGIADLIKKRRKKLGLSQSGLGLRVWPNTVPSNAGTRIKRFEAGQRPRVDELELIARALEMDVADLMEVEYGHGWQKTTPIGGGCFIPRETLDYVPELEGILNVLNDCVKFGMYDMADDALAKLKGLRGKEKAKAAKK